MTRLVKNGEKISGIVGNLLELKISSLQNEPQHKKKIERKTNNLHQLIHFCEIINQTRSITSKTRGSYDCLVTTVNYIFKLQLLNDAQKCFQVNYMSRIDLHWCS